MQFNGGIIRPQCLGMHYLSTHLECSYYVGEFKLCDQLWEKETFATLFVVRMYLIVHVCIEMIYCSATLSVFMCTDTCMCTRSLLHYFGSRKQVGCCHDA